MTFLILAIVSSTINHLLFKAFSRFRIDLLNVIVVNYAVCVIIGYRSSFESVFQDSIFMQTWYPFSILQGVIFVGCLFLLGRTTGKQGVIAAVLSTRLSVAIPTVAAFLLYNDIITAPKTIGILAALFALYLSCGDPTGTSNSLKSISILPFALFVVFGTHSTLIKFVQERFLDTVSYHAYVMSAFFAALLFSGSVLVWRLFKRRQVFRWKDLVWGLALGCTNYGAIYFLIRALSVPGRQSSQLFPTISILVVGLSSFGAWAFFKERPGRQMLGALVIGAGAIVLINLS
jgi:drug/metabolite transporter (DMT)-like permease